MQRTVKNLTNSPYDIDTIGGAVRVPAMGEVTAAFTPEYLAALRGFGLFTITEADERDPAVAKLQEEAAGLGVEVDGRWGVKRLETEIAKARKK